MFRIAEGSHRRLGRWGFGFLNILALKLLYVCPREHGKTWERRHRTHETNYRSRCWGSVQCEKIKTKVNINSEGLDNP